MEGHPQSNCRKARLPRLEHGETDQCHQLRVDRSFLVSSAAPPPHHAAAGADPKPRHPPAAAVYRLLVLPRQLPTHPCEFRLDRALNQRRDGLAAPGRCNSPASNSRPFADVPLARVQRQLLLRVIRCLPPYGARERSHGAGWSRRTEQVTAVGGGRRITLNNSGIGPLRGARPLPAAQRTCLARRRRLRSRFPATWPACCRHPDETAPRPRTASRLAATAARRRCR